jgi:hypothetical protein
MNINYEFVPIESKWISISYSDHDYPTIIDLIQKESNEFKAEMSKYLK